MLSLGSRALLLLAAACSDSSGPEGAPTLPASFRLTATAAEVYPDGSTVDCAFDLLITLGGEEFQLPDPDPTSRFWNSFSLLAGTRRSHRPLRPEISAT